MIIVCSLSDLKNVCESVKPSHLVSVIDPGFEPQTPKGINHHLKLGFDDIVSINDNGPLYRLPGQDNTKEQILFDENKCLSVVNFLKTSTDVLLFLNIFNFNLSNNIAANCFGELILKFSSDMLYISDDIFLISIFNFLHKLLIISQST